MGGKRREKRPLTDEERMEIALARFAQGKRTTSITELAERFARDPAVISKAISSAFERGLVSVVRATRPAKQRKRMPAIEDQLRRRFSTLRAAIVIETDDVSRVSPTPLRAPLDEDLDRQLGEAMAAYLIEAQPFRDRDVIGVASDRCVACTLDALRSRPLSLRASGITIMSLTGSVHSRHTKLWLDADLLASLLSTCFDQETSLHLIRRPLTYGAPAEAREAKAHTWLGDEQWHQCKPNVALVGIDILARGHRFFEEATADSPGQEPILAPVHEKLADLARYCEQMSTNFTPVAGTCNHLLFIPPTPQDRVDHKIEARIRQLVGEINARFLTIDDKQLAEIEELVLVAGTSAKAPAINELLKRSRVRLLCTDTAAAERVLAR